MKEFIADKYSCWQCSLQFSSLFHLLSVGMLYPALGITNYKAIWCQKCVILSGVQCIGNMSSKCQAFVSFHQNQRVKSFFLQSHMVALMFNCHKIGFFFFLKKHHRESRDMSHSRAMQPQKPRMQCKNAMQEMLSFRKNTLSLLK